MIKDSKLIGTKIKSPYEWKKFKVGELFDFVKSDTSRLGSFVSNDTVSLIKATSSNNGVDSVFKSYTGLCYKNILTIGMRGSFKVFLHTSAVVLGDNVAGFKLKDTTYSSSNRVLLFLGCLLEKLYSYGSGYAGYPTWSKLERHDALSIPVLPNSQPDFEWMEQYMKLVQEDYLKQKELSNQAEIKAYLTESQTDSLEITDADRKFLRDFEKLPRRKFKVGELFDHIVQGKRLKRSDHISGNIPFIMAGTTNTGISDYISNPVKHFPSNSITIDIFGNAFYRDYEYGMGDDTGAYWSESSCISKFTMLFIVTVLNKSLTGTYGYGHKLRSSHAVDLSITLPICAVSQVDVESIAKYMRIQAKPLVDNVAETLAPVGGGGFLIDIPAIERYMRLQVKLTIIKRKERLDRELKLMEQMS